MEIINGIGYSFRPNAVFVTALPGYGPDAGEDTTAAPPLDLTAWPWSPWGSQSNNLLPAEMAKYIEECGILNAALNAKSIMSVGKGIQPYLLKDIDADGNEDLLWLNDDEILSWVEDNGLFEKTLDFAYDRIAYGWRAGTFILNRERNKINRVIRKDVYDCRLQKKDPMSKDPDLIRNLYLCSNWDKVGYNPKEPNANTGDWVVTIPALKEGYETEDLKKHKSGFEFAFIDRPRRNGRQYYPLPLWWSAKEWVKVAREIPLQKNAIFQNAIMLRYMVTIADRYWVDVIDSRWGTLSEKERADKQSQTYDSIDKWLSGTHNQGKSLFAGTYIESGIPEPQQYIKIEALDDKFKDGKLLPDSSAANVEILMALLMNPAFIGAGMTGGASHGSQSGGSNIRESYMTQIMLMEAERKQTVRIMNIVAEYNGWNKKYNKSATYDGDGNIMKPGRRLVWRYQSGILTTLDTGKSTKAENL
jgi:hypothetical protein